MTKKSAPDSFGQPLPTDGEALHSAADTVLSGGGAHGGGIQAGKSKVAALPYDDQISLSDLPTGGDAEKLPAGHLGRVDRYVLRRKLGQGGFGAVYLAFDEEAQIEVALKTLPGIITHSPEEFDQMRRNFALVQKLVHSNIANLRHLHKVETVDEAASDALRLHPGDYLVVMEYVAGASLSAWRQRFPERKVPIAQALQICRQLAAALDYAHGEKIIHRDIKPANVMISGDDHDLKAKMLDFGLAAEIRSSLTRLSGEGFGSTSGTRPYMSPEQWQGRRQNAASDQYALAVLFYELVSGHVPFASAFESGDSVVMLNAACNLQPEPLPELDERQNLILQRALAKNPTERFASCGEFVAALAGRGRMRGAGGASRIKRGGSSCSGIASTAGVRLWGGDG